MTNCEVNQNQDVCKDKPCPGIDPKAVLKALPIPVPDGEIPIIPNEELDEYKKISKVKRQPIDDAKNKSKRDAKKARDDKLLEVELTFNTAKNVFETAKITNISNKSKEETNNSYKIETYYVEYINGLIAASNAIPSLKNCDSPNDVPDYIKAVYATTFYKQVAELKITYQANLNSYENTFLEAKSVWDLAISSYCKEKCAAEAQREKADLEADLIWRIALKTEVDNACKA